MDDDHHGGFTRAFPHEPDLDALVAAFERGDFGRVQRDARRLAGDSTHAAEVRAAAAELFLRTRPDPLSATFFALTALLLLVLAAYWSWKAGGPPR